MNAGSFNKDLSCCYNLHSYIIKQYCIEPRHNLLYNCYSFNRYYFHLDFFTSCCTRMQYLDKSRLNCTEYKISRD